MDATSALRWFLDASIPAVVVDPSGHIREVNAAGERLLGEPRSSLLGQDLGARFGPEDRPAFVHLLSTLQERGRGAGSQVVALGDVATELHAAPVRLRDGSAGACVQLVDRSDVVEREADLRRLAFEDPMTGLSNRRGFDAAAEQLLRIARREHRALTFMFIDIEGLKKVNDSHGHATGDRLIEAAGAVLRSVFREADAVGRYGGDEFVVLALTNASSSAEHLLRRLRDTASSGGVPLPGGGDLQLRLTVGLVHVDDAVDVELADLVDRGDRAMYGQRRRDI